ncbi:hypothetical protein P5V15_010239 [Pogonomyrmex californicus]
MDNIEDRKKIAKQIAKTSDSIRKKYRALKTSKIDEEVALERRFKPIVEPLKQIVENIEEPQPIKKEAKIAKDIDIKKKKHKDSNDDDDNPIRCICHRMNSERFSTRTPYILGVAYIWILYTTDNDFDDVYFR